MKMFYVEVYFPPYPMQGRKFRVFTELVNADLSPDLIALYKVKAEDKQDALAQVMVGQAFAMISPQAKQLKFV